MDSKATLEYTQSLYREYWLNHMYKCASIGLGHELYCSKNGLDYSEFIYWRGQFKVRRLGGSAKPFSLPKNKQARKLSSRIPQLITIKLLSGNFVYIPAVVGMEEIAKLIRLIDSPSSP